jgi:hypothetical protein
MSRSACVGLLAAALAAAAGCQGNKSPYTFAPVEGTVRKDGKPLPGVIVVFWGDGDAGTRGPPSAGPTDATGHYRLHTNQGIDGALVGRHRVCILEAPAPMLAFRGRNPANNNPSKDVPAADPSGVPPGYHRREQTPLRAEVRPGEQVLDFDVK